MIFPDKILFQEDEKDSEDEAGEGGQMVPVKRLSLKEKSDNQSEYNQRDNLLDDFELKQAERASVAGKAKTVGRNLGAIFKKRYAPREKDDQDKRPACGDLHFLKFQVTVPRECHEYVGQHQQ